MKLFKNNALLKKYYEANELLKKENKTLKNENKEYQQQIQENLAEYEKKLDQLKISLRDVAEYKKKYAEAIKDAHMLKAKYTKEYKQLLKGLRNQNKIGD